MTLQSLAREARNAIEAQAGYVFILDIGPDWVVKGGTPHTGGLISRAHGDFQPPDDMRLRMILAVLEAIIGGATPDELWHILTPDGTIEELAEWLGSNPLRQIYVDEALTQDTYDSVRELLRAGQSLEFREVARHVLDCLQARLDHLKSYTA